MSSTPASQPGASRVAELDLLRFIAALLVVFFHYAFRGYAADALSAMPYPLLAPVARYGYLGVELFFMISGFVILMTAAGGNLRRFVASRAARLFPALWACCTLTYLATLAMGAPRFTASPAQYLVNLAMLPTMVGMEPMDGAYWSLFVEVHFYAMVAVLIALGWIDRAEAFLGLWLAVVGGIELAHVGRMRWLLLVDHAALFIGGALCYLVWQRGLTPARACMLGGAWLLATWQAVGHAHELERTYHTPMSGPVVASLISAFFVVMLLVALRRTGPLGQLRWGVLGALTYPLYLLHQDIGYMIFNRLYPALDPHLLLWGTLALMLGAAYFVCTFVEPPLSSLLKARLGGRAH